MSVYYNEHDPFAAAWLRELIRDNLIAPGEVDERSIEDVRPDELRPFRQCHFFAGIGVWSIAARLAGWSDDTPLWSGSCPCQPFSSAGKGEGFNDERHLWPAFHYLIEQCAPPLVVGEQVAGADGDAWLDLVSADMDATGYAFGSAETCAAGFGAPHERTRNYWVACRMGDSDGARLAGSGGAERGRVGPDRLVAARRSVDGMADLASGGRGEERPHAGGEPVRNREEGGSTGLGDGGIAGGLGDATNGHGRGGERRAQEGTRADEQRGVGPSSGGHPRRVDHALGDGRGAGRDDHAEHDRDLVDATCSGGGVADADGRGSSDGDAQSGGQQRFLATDRGLVRAGGGGARAGVARRMERPGPTNGWWRAADWLRCRDERWRPVEPGTFPLVNARTFRNRVGLLRGAGNAITLGQAEGWMIAVRYALERLA